jgi:hypothetical protein
MHRHILTTQEHFIWGASVIMNSVLTPGRIARLALLLLAAVGLSGAPAIADEAPSGYPRPLAPCPGERFSDTCPSDWFYPHVMALSDLGAISGYADGTFRPGNTITRGQIMKVLVIALGLTAPEQGDPTFVDVPLDHPFYLWIEIGVSNSIVGGYNCGGSGEPCPGSYFRPAANVTRGQVAKMVVNAMDWTVSTPSTPTFNDVPASSPYYGYVESATSNAVIDGYACGGSHEPCPGRYFRPANTSTRAQAAKMVDTARGRRPTATPTVTGTPPTATNTTTPHTPTRTRTATRTRTPTPSAGLPCAMFPANNIWNRNIAALPTHVLSNSYINSIGAGTALHPDFGSGLWDGGPIGIPYITVPGSQPRVPVRFDYDDESDPGPYPVPTNAPIEGGPSSDGDRHVLIVDRDACVLYEMYSSYPQADGSWDAGSGARWQLTSNALRPDTWTSADAAGLPILPGLVRYDEVASGAIRHALRFTSDTTQQAYLWPARHYASDDTNPNQPPMGLRVRLKAGVNISGYPTQLRVILQALKDYGMFLADNGSSWYISGAPDERWDNDVLHLIDNLHGSDFEAVDESSLMIDPNSGQSR